MAVADEVAQVLGGQVAQAVCADDVGDLWNGPVTGDEVYGNGSPKWLCGQCLHAKKIGFVHPNGQYMEFDSELPDYFQKLLKNLETQKTEI